LSILHIANTGGLNDFINSLPVEDTQYCEICGSRMDWYWSRKRQQYVLECSDTEKCEQAYQDGLASGQYGE